MSGSDELAFAARGEWFRQDGVTVVVVQDHEVLATAGGGDGVPANKGEGSSEQADRRWEWREKWSWWIVLFSGLGVGDLLWWKCFGGSVCGQEQRLALAML